MFEKLNNKYCNLMTNTLQALVQYEPWLRRVDFKPIIINNFEVVLENRYYKLTFKSGDRCALYHNALGLVEGTAEEVLRKVHSHVYHGDWYVYVGSEVICPLQHYNSKLCEYRHFVGLRDILYSHGCDLVTQSQTSVEWRTEDGRTITLTNKVPMMAVCDTLRKSPTPRSVARGTSAHEKIQCQMQSTHSYGMSAAELDTAMLKLNFSEIEQRAFVNQSTLTGRFKQQLKEIKMNVLDLVAAANLHMVSVRFSTTPGRTYDYKSEVAHEPGSKVVVDSPSSGLAVVEVVACVKGLQSQSNFPKYKWIVAKVDDSRYKELLEKEELAIKTIAAKQRAEKVKKELEGLGVSQDELLQLLGLAKGD